MTFQEALNKDFARARCASLPSSEAAMRLVQGDPSASIAVVTTSLLRAGLIGVGLFLAGEREHLLRNSLAAAGAIETFVLGWTYFHRNDP